MNGLTIVAFTHRGRVRAANEDAIAIGADILTGDMNSPVITTAPDDCCVLMVADGIGGHAHGAVASRAVLDYLVTNANRISNPSSCAEAVEHANQHLYALLQRHRLALGMGTTLVGAILTPAALLWPRKARRCVPASIATAATGDRFANSLSRPRVNKRRGAWLHNCCYAHQWQLLQPGQRKANSCRGPRPCRTPR